MEIKPANTGTEADFILFMSLHTLVPAWSELGLYDVPMGPIRQAAETAIRACSIDWEVIGHEGNESLSHGFFNNLSATLSQDDALQVRGWFQNLGLSSRIKDMQKWDRFFAFNRKALTQSKANMGLISELIQDHRANRAKERAFEEWFYQKISPVPLPDWDMWIHAKRHICYMRHGKFGPWFPPYLAAPLDDRLTVDFFAKWARRLPQKDADILYDLLIEREWEREEGRRNSDDPFLNRMASDDFDPSDLTPIKELVYEY